MVVVYVRTVPRRVDGKLFRVAIMINAIYWGIVSDHCINSHHFPPLPPVLYVNLCSNTTNTAVALSFVPGMLNLQLNVILAKCHIV